MLEVVYFKVSYAPVASIKYPRIIIVIVYSEVMIIFILYISNANQNTFCFNIKSSLLELLCTLARLCKGSSLQPLRFDFFGIINFPSHLLSRIAIYQFFVGQEGQQTTRGKLRRAHMSALHSPNRPTHPGPSHPHPPTTYPLPR